MVRGSLVVLALTATVAHAQGNSEIARDPGATTLPGEGTVVVSRSPVPGRDAGTGTPGGGVDTGAAVKAIGASTSPLVADCSVSETLLSGQAPAVRYYAAPARPAKGQYREWGQAPHVQSIVRCDRRLYLQVYSQSADSWIIGHARVESPQGKTLPVAEPKYRQQGWAWDINLIAVEVPSGAKLFRLKLHMVGKDGRVAQTTVEDLP